MRGQSFDVFKLIIAAAVAVIILGILLSILGQFTVPAQDPVTATNQLLRESYSSAIKKTFASTVTFTKGLEFSVASLVKGTGIPPEKVTIEGCISGIECPDGQSAKATADVTAKVTVDCRDVTNTGCKVSYESPV